VATVAAAALSPSQARSDADPASDVLLGSPVFYPFQPPVATSLQNQLQEELAQLQKQGLNLKVAIIGSPVDLGALPDMFGKPQTYAEFLEREISFNQPQPLLVVMPQGFGVSHAVPLSSLTGVKVDAAGKSDGLARTAIVAVQRIAQAAVKPIAGPAHGGSSSPGGTSPLITFGAPALLVLIVVSALALRQRRLLAEPDSEPDQSRDP